ncbi:MAG: hypothetical protein IT462_10760 [Planctomycetes bacterium]|nr:hypothetical protein [Planctomycetota bacterium]
MPIVKNTLLVLALTGAMLSGCRVIGYQPTDEEAEALARGEDPRANEKKPKEPSKTPAKTPEKQPETPREQVAGPARATVLRWTTNASLTVEAEGKLQVVVLPGVAVPGEYGSAERARMNAEESFPYGTPIKLSYPTKDKDGKTIYRDADDRLLATIEKDVP